MGKRQKTDRINEDETTKASIINKDDFRSSKKLRNFFCFSGS